MTKGKFIKAISNKKKNSEDYFYLIQILVDDNVVDNFMNGEDFKKIVDKKPVLLKDYNFIYENKVVYGKIQPVLVDFQEIK